MKKGGKQEGKRGAAVMKPIRSKYLGNDDDDVPGMMGGRGLGVMDVDFDGDITMELDNGPGAGHGHGHEKKQLLDANFFNDFPDDFDEEDLS